MDFDASKIKDLIVGDSPTEQSSGGNDENLPIYARAGIKASVMDTSEESGKKMAIETAMKCMQNADQDLKLALDGAKAFMSWYGAGQKGKTTVIANNAQINQIADDPKKTDAILGALEDIVMLTEGIKTEDGQIKET